MIAITASIKKSDQHLNSPGGVGVLLYVGMVGRFPVDDLHFWDFQSDWVPILYLNKIQLTPSFNRKIGLSLSSHHKIQTMMSKRLPLFAIYWVCGNNHN